MSTTTRYEVRFLDAAASGDTGLIDLLTALINDVYVTAESGLWRDGATRTTAAELAGLVAAREIAVATTADGQVVGCVRVHEVAGDASEFGMLVSAPAYRGTGIGRTLVHFVEHDSRRRGRRAMHLELLVPRSWQHPSKEFLKSWYGRSGYQIIDTRRIDDAYPHLAPLLATPCDLEVHEKLL
jgi:GNAT superfamily N-acetyltransferase